MSKEVDIRTSIPANVAKATRQFVLPKVKVSEKEFWRHQLIQDVVALIDFYCAEEKLDPMPTLEKYGLTKYYYDP